MPLEVVEWLERICPDVAPPHDQPHVEIIARSAQVELVRSCRALYERQEAERLADA